MNQPLNRRVFGLEDQLDFARLSGDFNPMHIDPVLARRAFFGSPVVHGVHTLLLALDAYVGRLRSTLESAVSLSEVRAEFPAPAALDRVVETHVVSESVEDGVAQLEQRCEGVAITKIRIAWEGAARNGVDQGRHVEDGLYARRWPAETELDRIEGMAGSDPLRLDRDAARTMFPDLMDLVAPLDIAQLLAATRVVGMECPGLRSMLARLEIERKEADGPDALRYQVARVDPRFSLVFLSLEGPTFRGGARAFYRPAPVEQPPYAALRGTVAESRFRGQSALVIGGSRGIGEATAKLIAAGGGRVAITYVSGHADAERVRSDIESGGGAAEVVALDVRDPLPGVRQLAERGFSPTHLYYYASPKIFVKKGGLFDEGLFRSFTDIYVEGFHRTLRACRTQWAGELEVLYPSTVAVEERVRDLAEYSAAKAAGESLAHHLTLFDAGVRVHIERLPRIATDQTTTLTPYPAADAVDILRPLLERLHAASAPLEHGPGRTAARDGVGGDAAADH